ncbi:hypothetical protein J3458_001867 [Metarhizium acridum]|uniref:uncharacterized protein n=1 Tax=Metarhizium acridum TaxID=92637 RepID=UPI001C6D1AB4|nr:hypothetical protein J3458_001867 [Metarhizium acridum]
MLRSHVDDTAFSFSFLFLVPWTRASPLPGSSFRWGGRLTANASNIMKCISSSRREALKKGGRQIRGLSSKTQRTKRAILPSLLQSPIPAQSFHLQHDELSNKTRDRKNK